MIDRETVERIKAAADIVDVVSDFVTLKKSGANYKGLCPFHNERTPSFIVSPARGTCHCFGCGKGGNAVSFIMEHEQLSYPDALRWLARKYHIEIKERELTDQERQEQNERESMFIVNEWAAQYFEDLLQNNADGQAIGMEYFRSRGFRDDVIKKFRLGYDLTSRYALAQTARRKGYKEDFLLKTGICYRNDRGDLIDRYSGRAIFPWIGLNGKVVAFSARVLDARTKGVQQKYVNSPDSEIFHKGHELYGIYQAKRAISKQDRVFLVEGQADVISMYQNGYENVVAGSGTALTPQQIQIMHRLTSNITLIYDDDEAGHHAALVGTDKLLAQGMNLKVLLFPNGDDPDSYARAHTPEELKDYIESHQVDFIEFKIKLLLDGQTDPLKRSQAINSIVESIAQVPDQILRDTYLKICAQRTGVNEATLINQMNRFIRSNREADRKQADRQAERDAIMAEREEQQRQDAKQAAITHHPSPNTQKPATKVERMVARLIVKHGGDVVLENVEGENGQTMNLTAAQYIWFSLQADNLKFNSDLYWRILEEAAQKGEFEAEPYFVHHDDITIAQAAQQLTNDPYQMVADKEASDDLVRYPDEKQRREAWRNRVRQQTEHLMLDYRREFVEVQLKQIQQAITQAGADLKRLTELMTKYKDLQEIRNALAAKLGNDIIL